MESKLASSNPAINWIAVLCSPVSIQEIFPKKNHLSIELVLSMMLNGKRAWKILNLKLLLEIN